MVNNLASPLQSRDVLDQMPAETAEDWQVIAERLAAMPHSLSTWAQSLREAADHGVVSARQLLLGAEQARGFAARDGFFAGFAAQGLGDDAQRTRLTEAARAAAEGYREIADVLESLADRAPEADAVGREAYQLASRTFLGTEIDLEETYAWGIEELRAIVAEQETVARRINEHHGTGGGSSVTAAKAALNSDPSRVLHGTEVLRTWMQQLSDRAITELAGTHFDIPAPLHQLECRIAQTGSGGIYYTGPSEDLTRPGRMWWDVPAGTTEFHTWLETTTVYHEGVPGHHLQVGTQTLQASTLNRWRALMCWVSGHGRGLGAVRRTAHGPAGAPRGRRRPPRHARCPAPPGREGRARHRSARGPAHARGHRGLRGRGLERRQGLGLHERALGRDRRGAALRAASLPGMARAGAVLQDRPAGLGAAARTRHRPVSRIRQHQH